MSAFPTCEWPRRIVQEASEPIEMPCHRMSSESNPQMRLRPTRWSRSSVWTWHMAWLAHVLTCCEGPASLGFASRVSDKAVGPVELPFSAPTVPDWCSTARAKCLVNGFHKDLCCESFQRCELRMLAGVQAPVAASGCAACASQLTTASFASLPIPRPSWASPD